jgi:hypothetical protein
LFSGLAIVTLKVGEGEGAIAAFQPTNFAHRISKSGRGRETIQRYTGNANSVTIGAMLISPRPDLPEPSDNIKLPNLEGRGHFIHSGVRVQHAPHFYPITGHGLLPPVWVHLPHQSPANAPALHTSQ